MRCTQNIHFLARISCSTHCLTRHLTPRTPCNPTSSCLLFPSHWHTSSTPQIGLLFGRCAELKLSKTIRFFVYRSDPLDRWSGSFAAIGEPDFWTTKASITVHAPLASKRNVFGRMDQEDSGCLCLWEIRGRLKRQEQSGRVVRAVRATVTVRHHYRVYPVVFSVRTAASSSCRTGTFNLPPQHCSELLHCHTDI